MTTSRRRWFSFSQMPLAIFALVWNTVGLLTILLISRSEAEYDRRVAAVAQGDVVPEVLRVLEVQGGPHGEDDPTWLIVLGSGGQPKTWREHHNATNEIRVGSELNAYRFGDEYLIPTLDTRGFRWVKWVFLATACNPVAWLALVAYRAAGRSGGV